MNGMGVERPLAGSEADRAGLVIVLTLAAAVRVWGIQRQSLFCDEVVEASIARLPWRQIITYPDGFPPLYHLVLSAWSRAFPSPESGRWISALFGVAAVYAGHRWARHAAGSKAGLFAGLLLAISPLHVYLSQEMRAYALYFCLTGFALMYFFEALASNSRASWTGFALSAGLAINTHYYAALLAGMLALALVYYRRSWIELRRGVAAFICLAALSAPALMLLPGDVAYQSEGFAGRAPLLATLAHTAYSFFGGFSLGPSLTELHVLPMRSAAIKAAPWAAFFGVIGLWLLWQGWLDLRRRRFGAAIVVLALASAPAIGAAGALAGVGPKVRYWCWILLPLVVWLAAGTARGWHGRCRLATRIAFAALATAQLFAVVNRHVDEAYAIEDVRSAAELIREKAAPGAPVAVVADYMAPTARYYLDGAATLYGWLPYIDHGPASAVVGAISGRAYQWTVFPRNDSEVRGSRPFDRAAIDEWLRAVREISPDGKFWLIYSREYHGDPGGLLLEHLQQSGIAELESQFPGVRVFRGRL